MSLRKNISFLLILAIVFVSCKDIILISSAEMQNSKVIPSYGTIKNEGSPSGPSNGLPRLHTEGSLIKDEAGNIVHLKGVTFSPWIYNINGQTDGHTFSEQDVINVKSWGSNWIRLGFNQDWWDNDPSYKKDLIDMVNTIESHDMYVIFSNHWSDTTNQLIEGKPHNWDTWKAMWVDIATQFKGKTSVLYELYNEPHDLDMQLYRDQVEECIDGIRAVDPDVIIVIQGEWWGSYFEWVINYPVRRSNIMYSGHYYYYWEPNYGMSKSGIRQFMSDRYWDYVINTLNKPLIVTELGAYSASEVEWMRNFLDIMETDGISWTAWDWHTYPEQPALLQSDWVTPNYAGNAIIDYM